MINKNFIKQAAAFLLGAAVCAGGFVYAYELRTVGMVNGRRIRAYEVSERLNARKGNAVKQCAKDIVFLSEMEKLGIKVSKEEVEAMLNAEAEKYGGIAEMEKIMLDTSDDINTYRLSIKKSLLAQKAIDLFAEEQKGTEEEKREKGREKYQQLMDKIEQTTEITIF